MKKLFYFSITTAAVAAVAYLLLANCFLHGTPAYALFSQTDSTFSKSDFAFGTSGSDSIQSSGYVTSLRGRGKYCAGENNLVYYLGNADRFAGTLFIGTIGQPLIDRRIAFYLNYRRIPFTIDRAMGSYVASDTVVSISNDEDFTLNFLVASIPSGLNELCVVIDDNRPRNPQVSGEVRLKDADMKIVQLVRGNATPFSSLGRVLSYRVDSIGSSGRSEFLLLRKDERIAIVNNTDQRIGGVFFSDDTLVSAHICDAPPRMISLFSLCVATGMRVYYVSAPFSEFEKGIFRNELTGSHKFRLQS